MTTWLNVLGGLLFTWLPAVTFFAVGKESGTFSEALKASATIFICVVGLGLYFKLAWWLLLFA